MMRVYPGAGDPFVARAKRLVTLVLLGVCTPACAQQPPHVATMRDLEASATSSRFVVRDGFWSAGDGGSAGFRLEDKACVAPDGATRVVAHGGKCWHLVATEPIDVRAFGARCDSVEAEGAWTGSDDAGALTKAFNSGLQIRVPSAHACYVASTVTDLARFADIGGGGMGMATIVGGPGANPVLRFGSGAEHPVNRTHLHDLSVMRANCGAAGSVGIEWASFNYAAETRVDVQCNATNRLVTGPSPTGISVEYTGDHIYSSNATQSYFTMADAAGVTLTDPEFGQNGGERFAVACQIVMTSAANALEVIGGTLNALGPKRSEGWQSDVLCFRGARNAATVVTLVGIEAETYRSAISSDNATPVIGELEISGGRFGGGPTSQFFALDPATALVSFRGTGFETGSAFVLGGKTSGYGRWATLSNIIVGGRVSIYGPPRPSGTDISITGGTFLSDVTIGGQFAKLLFSAPVLGRFLDLSTAPVKSISFH